MNQRYPTPFHLFCQLWIKTNLPVVAQSAATGDDLRPHTKPRPFQSREKNSHNPSPHASRRSCSEDVAVNAAAHRRRAITTTINATATPEATQSIRPPGKGRTGSAKPVLSLQHKNETILDKCQILVGFLLPLFYFLVIPGKQNFWDFVILPFVF